MLVKHLYIPAQHPAGRQKVPRQCPATARSGQSASWEGERPGCSQYPGSWHHDQGILHCEKHTEAHTASLAALKRTDYFCKYTENKLYCFDNRIFVFQTVEQKLLNFEEFNNVKNKSFKNAN